MPLPTLVDWLGRRDTAEVYRECRRCGKTVEAETERCPVCGTHSIVQLTIE